jgi:phenylacetate-CoA ligase
MNITPLEAWIADKIGAHPEPSALRAYQLEKLRETISYARTRSRFYKQHLSGLPDDIRSLSDITRIPFTYPEDIAREPNDFVCVSPRDIGRIVTLSTSGTTGSPKRIFFTEDDQELTTDFFHHGMTTLAEPSDRVMIFMPGTTPGSIGELLVKGLARFNCTGIIYGPIRDYSDAFDALCRENATVIVGIPSQIVALARSFPDKKPGVRKILLSADYVPEAGVKAIQKAWDAEVYGHYGMTETGLGGGVECQARHGYHFREADLYFEVIDPVSGAPVPDGEYGEVVFTTLSRRGMPLIRYCTGDRARFLTTPCPCGTVLRRLDRVTERLRDTIRLADGQTLSVTALDELVLSDDSIITFDAAIITKNGRDCLHVTVRANSACFDPASLHRRLQAGLEPVLASGALTLDIGIGDTGFYTTGTLKRRIADHRSV